MIGNRSFWVDTGELCEIVLTMRLDDIQLIIDDKIRVDDLEHIGNIQDHIIGDIFEKETELIVIECRPESSSMLIEDISSIGFKCILMVLDIIGDQISAITRFQDLAANETLDMHYRIFIEHDLDIVS